MHIAIQKVDKRMRAFGKFDYVIKIDGRGATNSSESTTANMTSLLDWCENTWGTSVEYLMFTGTGITSNKWSWYKDMYVRQIYLKSDKELNWFMLKWSVHA